MAIVALEKILNKLIKEIGALKIGRNGQFPFGWRKSAKGRTVWRLVEELITQNLEKNYSEYDLKKMTPSDSEISVFDFSCIVNGIEEEIYVNIKGSNIDGKQSKDDISKGNELIKFLRFTTEPTVYDRRGAPHRRAHHSDLKNVRIFRYCRSSSDMHAFCKSKMS